MGILVAGSIISPRIRTSISMASFPCVLDSLATILDRFTNQTIGVRSGNIDLNIAPWGRCNRLCAGEVDRFILATAPDNLSSRRVCSLNHYLKNLP